MSAPTTTRRRFRSPGLVPVLALRELWHDRRTALVLTLTLAAIIAPLLLLLGLKNGVLTSLRADLLRDPRTLEIVLIGSYDLGPDWFAATAARPQTGFVLPRTRGINASIDLLDGQRQAFPAVEMIPTAPGDPLLPPGLPVPTAAGEILLSTAQAETMDSATGAILTGILRRRRQGQREQTTSPLHVIGVVPGAALERAAILVHLDLLIASEDYRDGVVDEVAAPRNAPGQLPANGPVAPAVAPGQAARSFASARLYARDLDSVAPLAAALRAQGLEVRTQAERIATVQALDRVLDLVFGVIAGIGLGGAVLALGGALWVEVARRRRALALLRLFGLTPGALVLLPLVQALCIASLGLALAGLAYTAGAAAFNAALGTHLDGAGYACRLAPRDLAAALALVLIAAPLAAAAAAWRAGQTDPADSLRGE